MVRPIILRGAAAFLAVLTAVVFLLVSLWDREGEERSETREAVRSSENRLSETRNEAVQSGSETIVRSASDISIARFFEKKFDGREFLVGNVLEKHEAYTRFFVTYKSGDLTISGIMNVPSGEGPFPVLIMNHGYIDPAVYTNGRGLRREQEYLARQGFAVIHPDYRNHAESSRRDDGDIENRLGYVEDVINVVFAVRRSELPFLDTERIGMIGHSMGGGIAQTIAVAQPDLVKAIVLYAPVSMDYRDSYFKYVAGNPDRAKSIRNVYGEPASGHAIWDALSPKTFVDRIAVPILLFQGTRDTSVPPEWSEKTVALLRERGKDITPVIYDGESHEFGPRWGDFMRQATAFFRTNLASSRIGTESLSPPLDRPRERLTKKPFGIMIDPLTSPVQPERFRGYHTGIDLEVFPEEEGRDVPVRAMCDGVIEEKRAAHGYGGVMVESCAVRGLPVTVIYGHLRLSSVSKEVGARLSHGEIFGMLGAAESADTDGERQHLHLGIHRGESGDLRGYVVSADMLSEWIDPCDVICM